ncbi:MAG: TolC family protein [Bacteroidales bacterium]|nr:TolC family protein [Bacteroidales bacterium]
MKSSMPTLKSYTMESLKRARLILASTALSVIFNTANNAQQNMLDAYIHEGLSGNLALQQKLASYEQSIQDLRAARGLFYPSVSLNARYTVAEGGRIISFPVGDLLNDAYSTLNTLSGIHVLIDPETGEPVHFPVLENQDFRFYRPTEHETKLEVIQHIFNPKIYYNNRIKSDLAQVKQADATAYKRHLVAEIKTAYFNYLKAIQLNKLIDNTRRLLEENIRVNERLFENDKITIDNVYRSRAELGKLEQKKAEAIKMEQSAAAYFNFLLNKPLDSEIMADEHLILEETEESVHAARDNAIEIREELQMLQSYGKIARNNLRLNRSLKLPTLTGAVDYGFQGEEYRFTGDDDYLLASLVLRWDLFNGMQNDARIQHARLEQKMIEQKQEEAESVIRLEVTNSWYDLQAAYKSIEAAEMQVETTRKAFQIIARKFDQGQAGLMEFIDARTTMTNAEENLITARYDYLISFADYERAAGLYNLEK